MNVKGVETFERFKKHKKPDTIIKTNLNSVSEDHASSVDNIGRYASEVPERNGTASVCTPVSESESSKTIGGGPDDPTAGSVGGTNGATAEGPATGGAWEEAAGRPKASFT